MNTCLEEVQRDADSQAFWTLCEMEGVRFTLSLSLSFFTIYLMSGQCCVCSRSKGRWISGVLTMLSPAPCTSEPVVGAQPGPCQPEPPQKGRKGPLLPPGAIWLQEVCQPSAPLLGDAGWVAPQARHRWKYQDESNWSVSMDDSGLAVAAVESCPSQNGTHWQGGKRLSVALLSLHMPGAKGHIHSLAKLLGATEHCSSSSPSYLPFPSPLCERGCLPTGSSAQG